MALALAVPAAAQDDPAFAHGEPAFTAAATDQCGEVAITFDNPTPWLFVFDVRVDGEEALHESVAPDVTIAEGPLAGEEFGPRWRLVEVDGSAGAHEAVETFEFTESVEVRLAEGAEQKLFLDWQSVDVSAIKACEPQPDPDPTKPADPECVDVNSADAETLQLLKHVDADRAAQILELRPFTSVADLDRVDGLAAGGPRLAELVAGGDGFLPLCEITADGGQGGGDDENGLPVTGGSAPVLVGGAGVLGLVGGGLYLLARRRRVTFTTG